MGRASMSYLWLWVGSKKCLAMDVEKRAIRREIRAAKQESLMLILAHHRTIRTEWQRKGNQQVVLANRKKERVLESLEERKGKKAQRDTAMPSTSGKDIAGTVQSVISAMIRRMVRRTVKLKRFHLSSLNLCRPFCQGQ